MDTIDTTIPSASCRDNPTGEQRKSLSRNPAAGRHTVRDSQVQGRMRKLGCSTELVCVEGL